MAIAAVVAAALFCASPTPKFIYVLDARVPDHDGALAKELRKAIEAKGPSANLSALYSQLKYDDLATVSPVPESLIPAAVRTDFDECTRVCAERAGTVSREAGVLAFGEAMNCAHRRFQAIWPRVAASFRGATVYELSTLDSDRAVLKKYEADAKSQCSAELKDLTPRSVDDAITDVDAHCNKSARDPAPPLPDRPKAATDADFGPVNESLSALPLPAGCSKPFPAELTFTADAPEFFKRTLLARYRKTVEGHTGADPVSCTTRSWTMVVYDEELGLPPMPSVNVELTCAGKLTRGGLVKAAFQKPFSDALSEQLLKTFLASFCGVTQHGH